MLEQYTQQTGSFPISLNDMLLIQDQIGYEGVRWPDDAEQLAELIQPDFGVTPDVSNLNEFAPGYKVKADWGEEHCEFYWGLIIEHLGSGAS